MGLTGGIKSSEGAGPVLTFMKPGCRGTCPSYTATVWASGRVSYVGQLNVPRLGTHELQLPAATVAAMQQQARAVNFADLPESYATGDTDLPARVLTMYDQKGTGKSVTVENVAPEPVQALFDYIDNQLISLATAGAVAGPKADERLRVKR